MTGWPASSFAVVAMAVALLAGCGPTIAPTALGTQLPDATTASAPLPTWSHGDNWTFQGRNLNGAYTYRLTVLGEEMFEGVPAYKAQHPTYTHWYEKRTLGFLARARDGKVVRRIKPAQGLTWPVSVGRTWIQDVEWVDAESNQRFTYTNIWKVEGYEELKVPAGTFRAFKVVRRTGDAFDEFWYSAQAKYHVKRRGSSAAGAYEEELVAFTVK